MRTDEEILREAERIVEKAESMGGDYRYLILKFEDTVFRLLNLLRESINNYKYII